MPSLSYDLVVLGDDFAGLVTACLCASRGMRVLLAQTQRPQRSYTLGEERFPFESQFLMGLASPAVQRVTKELNFEHLLKRRLKPVRPAAQLLTAEIRLDLELDQEALAAALTREIGGEHASFLRAQGALPEMSALLETGACLPPRGFWERREISKQLAAIHQKSAEWKEEASVEPIGDLLELASAAVCGTTDVAPFGLLHSLQCMLGGHSEAEGELDAWHSLFIEKFKSHNGEIRRVLPQNIEQRWGKVTGLRTLEDQIRCDYLVGAMPIDKLASLFGGKAPKQLAELASQIHPRAFRYTLNLLVQQKALPEGMAPVAFSLLQPGEDPSGGNFLALSTRAAKRSGCAIATLEAIAAADENGAPLLAGMREAVLHHARERMPFLDQHIEMLDSPHEASDDKHRRALGGDSDEALPPAAFWDCPVEATLGVSALPYELGVKHFSVASRQTLPTLGLPGEFIAAWSAAKLASAGMAKSKTRAKSTVLAQSSS